MGPPKRGPTGAAAALATQPPGLHAPRSWTVHGCLANSMDRTMNTPPPAAQVKLSMNRIKQVMSQRAHTEHKEDPETKQRLLAFINTL